MIDGFYRNADNIPLEIELLDPIKSNIIAN